MFQYEYEKRPPSSSSCESRATAVTDFSRTFPSLPDQRGAYQTGREHTGAYQSEREQPGAYQGKLEPTDAYQSKREAAAYHSGHEPKRAYPSGYEGYRTRPLPPRPVCDRVPTKSSVPLKVWVIASASCFAVCAALVLATVVITKWGSGQTYTTEMVEEPELMYSNPHPIFLNPKTEGDAFNNNEIDNDIAMPVIEKLSIFKNVVATREKKTEDLISKPQLHPIHDPIEHIERRIEKKDQAIMPSHDIPVTNEVSDVNDSKRTIADFNDAKRQIADFNDAKIQIADFNDAKGQIADFNDAKLRQIADFNDAKRQITDFNDAKRQIADFKDARRIPDFKPTLPDVFLHSHAEIKLPDGYMVGLRKQEADYEEYYNDDNLYDDYMQSNSMTNYLIEKVQELHDWITTDPDFESVKNVSKIANKSTEFNQVLKALNESLIQGNASIIMSKLKDIYFGDNYTSVNHSRKMIISNSTDLLSFGILTLDIMLLHNIQLMAWENQEAVKTKMLKDPDVFAFNALFMDPGKVEAKQSELMHHREQTNGFPRRQNLRQDMDDFDIGKSILENFLEVGMSTARAAIHLGRAYKNTKAVINQLSNREVSSNTQVQLSRNIDDNAVALNHLQNSFQGVSTNAAYTDLDCVWLLYCRNLAAAGRLSAPYGTMARINGMALRMLVGELPTDKAVEAMVYEALTGWSDLDCDDMFPRCSKADAAAVVMATILQPARKTHARS